MNMNNILGTNLNCDCCNKEFILEAKDIKTRIINDVEVSYFECKHCKHKYITTCIDDYIRKEQRRYNRLTDKDKKLKCLQNMKRHSDTLKLKIKDKL